MSSHEHRRPKNTWRGWAITMWRMAKGLLAPAKLGDVTFTLEGQKLTGEQSMVFDAAPDRVWQALWQSVILEPPHRSIADVRPGERSPTTPT